MHKIVKGGGGYCINLAAIVFFINAGSAKARLLKESTNEYWRKKFGI